jgi:transcriptional regulator with XRE-family HTH domain
MTLGERIRAARARKGLTQRDLAEAIGVSVQAVSQWENNDTSAKLSRVTQIAEVLSVEPKWLLSAAALGENASPEHISLVQAAIRTPLVNLEDAVWFSSIGKFANKPDIQRDLELTYEALGPTFAFKVCDNSMSKRFREGDIVIADTALAPQNGDFVVVVEMKNPRPIFRQYVRRNSGASTIIHLKPLNKRYRTVAIGPSNLGMVLGVLIEHRSFRAE